MVNNQRTSNTASGNNGSEPCGSVLVCGGGVAGIQASLDLSAAGFHVHLIEKSPAIGGGMARLDKTFPTGDCATCIISPKLVECTRDLNIDVSTMSEVIGLEGQAGNFKATVRKQPRFVDLDKCTGCGECGKVCPVDLSSLFDAGIGTRKGIDRPYAQASPNACFITKRGRATCSTGCPIDTSIQAYVGLISAGKFQEAADAIRHENPLPSICGRVCFHPCESSCNRGQVDAPVNIRALKRAAVDMYPTGEPPKRPEPTGKSVAIVGSGPAGLAAAHALALAGHQATVFEALPKLGGMLAVGIPDYRLPPDILQRDLDAIEALGVVFRPSIAVGEDVSGEQLEEDFNAVFVATGVHESRKLGIPGEDAKGVIHGVDFLRRFSLGESVPTGRRVVIIGGGNTAIDAARTAVRLGAKETTIVYRRTRREMPASEEEIRAAMEEGIKIHYLAAPVEVIADKEEMTAVECIRMQLGEPDESGRRKPEPVEGSEFTIVADTLIPAVSQSPDRKLAELLKLKTTDWGTIDADRLTAATSREKIFAGGDIVVGPSSVVDAIAHGKRAAKAMDNYLAGRELAEGIPKPGELPNPYPDEELRKLKRQTERAARFAPDEVPVRERIIDFREVELAYSAEDARAEARRCLNCAGCCECMQCVTACQAGAIIHDQSEEVVELNVGAVLLTPGFDAFDAARRSEFGFGHAKNVVTNVQFERILSAAGPTGGRILRPSDGKAPKRLAFIQCVGSRDSGCGNDYCSSVCCMATTKEAILAKEHEPDLDVTVFFLDLRAFGKDFDRYCERAKKLGVKYVRSFISRTYEMPNSRNLRLVHVDSKRGRESFSPQATSTNPGGETEKMTPDPFLLVEEEFDMVILSVGLEPSASLRQTAERLGITLNRWGFAETSELSPMDTSRPGVFVGGAFQEPKDIPDTVVQASAAAGRAMSLLAPARGSQVRKKSYPPERDIADEPPRVGVFVCHCGSNIASVVDVEEVVERARDLPHVAFAEHSVYTCADDSQVTIAEKVKEYRLNRVVIASCTPRTHEPIFRDTMRNAGLNPYLLEMANIRDQCSWVHPGQPRKATEKACDLVRMATGRAADLMPLKEETVPVKKAALVIGGGIAGLTTALALADQGFPVHLVEKQEELGGTAREIHATLDGGDVQSLLAETIQHAESHPRITVYLDAVASNVEGHIGDFTTTITSRKTSKKGSGPICAKHPPGRPGKLDLTPFSTQVEHGVVILATGATEQKPTSYAYGQDARVLTQLELSDRLGRGEELGLPDQGTVVMVQCVEQRNDERPYCSRVCCTTAVKNALELRKRYPKAKIIVLYRDVRTYGFREAAYRQAREENILFVRYEPENPPRLNANGKLELSVREPALGRDLQLNPDLVVLAAPMVPRADRQELSELLRVPLNADGFFLEAHMKLRPVDFASEGSFLCGTAHAPKFITETIAQANAVASRAAAVLSRKEMPIGGMIAWVDMDKCISCMTCVHVCPYMAPIVGTHNKAEVQGAVCAGCGSCSAECPAKAITLRHFVDSQILGAIDGLLAPDLQESEVALTFPEQVGVAQPRWHRS